MDRTNCRTARRCFTIFFAMAAVLLSFATPAYAQDGQSGSITVGCTVTREGELLYLAGDEYSLSKVSELTVEMVSDTAVFSYHICPDFAGYDQNWAELSASELHDAAQAMAEYAAENQLYQQTLITDQYGRGTFTDLDPGLYLISRTSIATENEEYDSDAFLVNVPTVQGTQILYQVTAEPKFSWENTTVTIPQTGTWLLDLLSLISMVSLAVLAILLAYKHRLSRKKEQ